VPLDGEVQVEANFYVSPKCRSREHGGGDPPPEGVDEEGRGDHEDDPVEVPDVAQLAEFFEQLARRDG